MKSHVELTKRQLQALPYLLACSTYEDVAKFIELHEIEERIQFLETKIKS